MRGASSPAGRRSPTITSTDPMPNNPALRVRRLRQALEPPKAGPRQSGLRGSLDKRTVGKLIPPISGLGCENRRNRGRGQYNVTEGPNVLTTEGSYILM
jgi:hypothetical protein